MSVKLSVSYPPDAKLYKQGEGPCSEINQDYLYSEQQKTWLVVGNVYVEKRLPKKVDKILEATVQEKLE